MESAGRTERKDTTINVRLPARTRDLIDSAASVSGKTRDRLKSLLAAKAPWET